MTFNEAELANIIREEVLRNSQQVVRKSDKKEDISSFEYISTQKPEYVSPLMTMNEDEILAFVEEFEVSELATLSVAELNRIGEVLGVEPSILLGEQD